MDTTLIRAPTRPDAYELASAEDRCAPRQNVWIEAKFREPGGHPCQTVVTDVSVAGFGALVVTSLKPGSRCWITLPGLASQEAELVWKDNTMIGCSFTRLLSQAVVDNLVRRYSHA